MFGWSKSFEVVSEGMYEVEMTVEWGETWLKGEHRFQNFRLRSGAEANSIDT